MKKKKLKRNYFSLVELMVVITIIGLLGGIVAMNVFQNVKEAKIGTTRASIVELMKQVDFYYMGTGKYPSSLNDLIVKPEGVKGWKGPYLRGELKPDAWHNPFVYVVNSGDKTNPYKVYSFGPDGVEGGDDDVFDTEEGEGGGAPGSAAGSSSVPASDTEEAP